MAGIDTVDPAYLCAPPVPLRSTLLSRGIMIAPNSFLTKDIRAPIGLRDIPDPGRTPICSQASRASSVC
jgi:hypothetical protein